MGIYKDVSKNTRNNHLGQIRLNLQGHKYENDSAWLNTSICRTFISILNGKGFHGFLVYLVRIILNLLQCKVIIWYKSIKNKLCTKSKSMI
jgi:hypothetical protein